MKNVLVVGGTGLVGSYLLRALSEEGLYLTTALVRKAGALPSVLQNTRELVFDFENSGQYSKLAEQNYDFVFCCLGTTRKKAGSASQFRRVDFDYPAGILRTVKNTKPVFGLVSSVGADSPTGLYLKTKFDLEQEVFASGLRFVIVRPSLLLGDRQEFRLGESLAIQTFGRLENLFRNHLGNGIAKYAPIHAQAVAQALLAGAKRAAQEDLTLVLEGRSLFLTAQ